MVTSRDPKSSPASDQIFSSLVVLTIIWILSIIGPTSPLSVLVLAGTLYVFLRGRKVVAAILLVLATPAPVFFAIGIYDYAGGQACIRSVGLPANQTTAHNLDPLLRCEHRSGGCFLMGNEWETHSPYNCAVKLLIACFGPMPGTYTGLYPTEVEAKEALSGASPVSPSDLEQDSIDIDGVKISLDAGVGQRLLHRIRRDYGDDERPITATVWQQQCVLLRIPAPPPEDLISAAIVILSRSAGRPFAYYAEGEYHHSSPPVPWRRHPTK